MFWLYLAIIGYTLLGIVAILDKFIVTNERLAPLVYAFYSSVVALLLILLLPFHVVTFLSSIKEWLIAVFAGLASLLSLYTMYKSFSETEVSHSGPLLGAVIPFFTVIFSFYFLGDHITTHQLEAIIILIAGSLLITNGKNYQYPNWYRGMGWGVLSGICFALFFVSAKYIYGLVGFFSGFVLVWGAMGLWSLALLLLPSLRQALRKPKEKAAQRAPWFVIGIDKLCSLAGVVLIQYAISAGSVSVVNALTGLEYALLVIFVALLSRWHPERFKEEYSVGELISEGIAVVLIAFGIGLLLA